MTDPDRRTLRLNAALDGELDPMAELEFQQALTEDPVLASEFRRLTAVRDATSRAAPREAAPASLALRIAELAGPPADPIPFPVRRRAWSARGAMALAAAFGALGLVVGAGVATLRAPPGGRDAAEIGLVSDFTRAALSGQPYDVASSDRHTVKPWLSGRTTVSADIVDLAAQGFALVGGRIAVVNRMPVPTLVYRHREHLIALTELPLDGAAGAEDGKVTALDGYHVARWTEPSLRYLAVSDADAETLAEFVAAFRATHAPATEPRGG